MSLLAVIVVLVIAIVAICYFGRNRGGGPNSPRDSLDEIEKAMAREEEENNRGPWGGGGPTAARSINLAAR